MPPMEPTANLRRNFALALLLILLALFSYMISGFLGSLVFAAAAALMFHPLQKWLERFVSARVAATVNLVVLFVLIIVPMMILLGLAAGQALNFVDLAGSWIGERWSAGIPLIDLDLPDWIDFEPEIAALQQELISKLGQIAGAAGRFVAGTLKGITQATALFLLNVFVAAYFFFYCLLSGEQLAREVISSLPLHQSDREEFLSVGANVTRSVLKSMVVIGAVQGFLSGLGFYLVGVSGVVFWGIVMGFLSLIPFIGPIIIWLPVALYMASRGDYWSAVFLAGWFWLLVASVDNVLRPMIVGSDTRMPDVLVLLTTLGGLFMFGAIGLLIGPLIGAMLMAAWAVYRRVFEMELAVEHPSSDDHQPSGEGSGE